MSGLTSATGLNNSGLVMMDVSINSFCNLNDWIAASSSYRLNVCCLSSFDGLTKLPIATGAVGVIGVNGPLNELSEFSSFKYSSMRRACSLISSSNFESCELSLSL